MYLQLKFSSGFKEIKLFVYNLFTYYMTKPRIFGMQVEANREVEGPSQKRLVINNSALIIEGTAISRFIKKFTHYDYCRYRIILLV